MLLLLALACPAGMVLLPAGSFKLGETGKAVQVAAFCLDKTEVTAGAFAACKTCPQRPAIETYANVDAAIAEQRKALCNAGHAERANHPANCVDFIQAEAFCKAQGKRLPSEEEWEWAARGTTRGTAFPWGAQEPDKQLCWRNKPHGTCPVGSFKAGDSPEGISDLSGNVWEWTSTKDEGVRIRRGGGWSSGDSSRVSAAIRFADQDTQRQADLGFRCAAEPRP